MTGYHIQRYQAYRDKIIGYDAVPGKSPKDFTILADVTPSKFESSLESPLIRGW